MTVHIVLELLFCVFLLAASAFFSGSEAAFFSLKTWQLESARGGKSGFDLVLGLLKNPPLLLVCILMGNETVNVTLSFVSSSIRARLFPGAWGAALAVLVTSVLLILCGEALPKAISAHFPVQIAKGYAIPLSLLVKVAGVPGRALLHSLERFPTLRPKHRLDPLDEIRHLIAAAEEAGSFGKQEREILAALLRMQQEPASSRMVPRTAMRFVSPGASGDEVLQAARTAKGGWLAVRGEGAEDVVGVLSPHDVLEWELGGGREPLSRWVHAVPVFPETRPLRLLFDEILRGGWPAAVLADEYGGVAGMVTRASLAETLLCGQAVGPAGGEAELLPGSMPFVQLRERYGDLPEDPRCKTLAGHVLNLAQRVPSEGESFEDPALRYTVRKATPRQVVEVEVEKVGR